MSHRAHNDAKPGDTDNVLLQKIADSVATLSGTDGGDTGGSTEVTSSAILVQAQQINAAAQTILAETQSINVRMQSNKNVGGLTSLVALAPTVTAELYAVNDSVGGKLTLTNALRLVGGTAILDSITVLDRSNSKAALSILIFSEDPTAATITDGLGFVASTDDLKVQAIVSVTAADWVTVNGKAYATLKSLGTVVKGTGLNENLYAAVVCVGTPTFAATTNFAIKFGFLQD